MSVIPSKPSGPVTDNYGQIYTYNAGLNQWILSGVDFQEPIVSEANNGVITPAIVKLLEAISTDITNGTLNGVKLAANPNAYWYLLRARNDFVRISTGNNQITVELNATKISRMILAQSRCIGPTGPKGLIGQAGTNGASSGLEPVYVGVITNGELSINTEIEAPLDTPISVRVYSSGVELFEGKISVSGTSPGTSTFEYPSPPFVTLDPKSTLTYHNGSVVGNLVLQNISWPANITYKIRQYGPQGLPGSDGNTFINISNNVLTDPSISANTVVKTIRRGQPSDIHYITGQVSSTMPVAMLKSNSDNSFVTTPSMISVSGSADPDTWVAVAPTPSTTKGLTRWQLQPDNIANITDTTLDLPTWVPLKVVGYTGWNGFAGANEITDCQEDLFIILSELTGITTGGTTPVIPTWVQAKSCDGSYLGIWRLLNGLTLPYYFVLNSGNNGLIETTCGYIDSTCITTTVRPTNIMTADIAVASCNDPACGGVYATSSSSSSRTSNSSSRSSRSSSSSLFMSSLSDGHGNSDSSKSSPSFRSSFSDGGGHSDSSKSSSQTTNNSYDSSFSDGHGHSDSSKQSSQTTNNSYDSSFSDGHGHSDSSKQSSVSSSHIKSSESTNGSYGSSNSNGTDGPGGSEPFESFPSLGESSIFSSSIFSSSIHSSSIHSSSIFSSSIDSLFSSASSGHGSSGPMIGRSML